MDSLRETGISDVYKAREAAAPRMFQDIQNSSQSCWISAAVYIRHLILPDHRAMLDALKEASNRAAKRGDNYRLSFCSLSHDSSEQSLAGKRNLSVLECWARREEDKTIAGLQQRIKRASEHFEGLAKQITALSQAIRPERRFFRDYLVPHSLVVIDDSIVYVSFYDWGTPRGTQALTIRFHGGYWGSKFVEESRILRSRYSYRDYRVIVFDFDGVIADSMAVQADAWSHAARSIGASPQVQKQLMRNFWMGKAGHCIFEHTGLGNGAMDQLRQTKDAEFRQIEATIRVFEDSPQVLDSLKHVRHYKLAIATTAEKTSVESFLTRHSVANCFDYVITDSDVLQGKPNADMLLSIAKYFECRPWQVCLVGDTHTDYDMSCNAGTDSVLFRSHKALGVPVECVTARKWRQLEEILLCSGNLPSAERAYPVFPSASKEIPEI